MPDARVLPGCRTAPCLPIGRSFRLITLALALAATVACSGGGTTDAAPAAGRGAGAGREGRGGAVVVVTSRVAEKPMAVKIRVVGNVEPASTVNVRSQVTGPIMGVHFTEGQDVTAGQLLFTIDPRPLETSLRQAQATLARDMAQLKNAEAQQARSADLLKQGLVAQAAHDALVATTEALTATVAADRAASESLQRQLTDTRITAPMAGRTGAILAHPGTLVTANGATALVVINQIAPVSVSFAVPARLLGDVRSAAGTRRLRAEAALAGDATASVVGEVNFVDNTVDPSTDTIRLKATFPNRDQRLWPGAFVEVTLNLSTRPAAVVVPTAAIQASQQGQMVYVVKADQTAEARPVTVAWTEGNEAVIDRGLTAGETVVTDGQLRLTPGARVSAAAPPAAAAAAAPQTGTTR